MATMTTMATTMHNATDAQLFGRTNSLPPWTYAEHVSDHAIAALADKKRFLSEYDTR